MKIIRQHHLGVTYYRVTGAGMDPREVLAAFLADAAALPDRWPRYVATNGEWFTAAPLPEEVPRRGGLCYSNALDLARVRGLRYSEGYATSPTSPLLVVPHAWAVAEDGSVADPTWPAPVGSAYYGLAVAPGWAAKAHRGRLWPGRQAQQRHGPGGSSTGLPCARMSGAIRDVPWGAVAVLVLGFVAGIAGKAIPDALSDRRKHAQAERLRRFDAGLAEARAFLVAADRVRRGSQTVSGAYVVLDGARGNPDKTVYERSLAELNAAKVVAGDAITDAENAYTALRLLMPDQADAARKYLDLCGLADAYPDSQRQQRETARQDIEKAISKALGG